MAVEWTKIAYYEDELLIAEQEVVGRLTGGVLDGIALGIADNNVVQMDDAGPAASGEYARFTANGIEGRPAADVMGDLSGQAAAPFSMNSQKITALLDPTADQEAATKKYVDDRINKSYSITIENPSDSDDITIAYTDVAITVTAIEAVITAGTSVTFWIMHNPDRTAAGLEVDDTIFTCNSLTTGNGWSSGFEDATIPAASFIWIEAGTVTGVVTELHITIFYTVD